METFYGAAGLNEPKEKLYANKRKGKKKREKKETNRVKENGTKKKAFVLF